MDFQSAMETFAEAWVAANTQTPLTEAAEAQALALSRSNEVLPSHEILIEKDNELDGDGTRTIASLNRGSGHDPLQPKIVLRPTTITAKSIPVHCLVEQVPSPQNCDQSTELQPTLELDSYAIIPSHTLFSELVRAALFKLGYASSDIVGAKGAIQIKNWKPLSFETITEDSNATVGEILGELTTVATLRIRLYSRPKISSANDVKEKLLQLLLTQSHSLLVSAGCPIDESLLTMISKGGNLCEIPEETRRRFDQWYVQQVLQHRQLSPASSHLDSVTTGGSSGGGGGDLSGNAAAHRTRMRTSFDPELELPKLHRWFGENQHPTRLQIQQYVRELNSLESRKGRKPLDVNNVVYWFKNARAAYKRAEQRQSNGAPHSPCHDSTSNDPICRETSSEDTVTEAEHRRSALSDLQSTPPNGATDHCSDNHGRAAKKSVNGQVCGSLPEAMDLSTTHRDVESKLVTNGHWKSGAAHKGEDVTDGDDEDVGVVVKQEPAEGAQSSDDTEDEDDDVDDFEGPPPPAAGGEDTSSEPLTVAHRKVSGVPCSSSPNQSHFHGQTPPSASSSPPSSLPLSRGRPAHSMLYMAAGFMPTAISAVLDERRKRNRTFIDPVTEVPRLEQWFAFNTHPPHSLILKYTDELNQMPYRQKFPKLEPKNVQFWFKNRRAKCKRLRLSVNLVTSRATVATAAASW